MYSSYILRFTSLLPTNPRDHNTYKDTFPFCHLTMSVVRFFELVTAEQLQNTHWQVASGCYQNNLFHPSVCSSIGKARHPMAKLVYNLLTMQELRRRLKECNLSAQGSRDQLIRRHQEFVHIYNAQCDSLNPKSGLDAWHRSTIEVL